MKPKTTQKDWLTDMFRECGFIMCCIIIILFIQKYAPWAMGCGVVIIFWIAKFYGAKYGKT